MRISCEVIRDLLPLYVEDMVSKDTRMLVEEHLQSCTDCVKELEAMKNQTVNDLPVDNNIKPLKKLRSALLKKKIQTILLTVMITLTITVVAIASLTSPEYIPYSEDVVNIFEHNDGTVILKFREDVSGYDVERYEAEARNEYSFHITTWNSFWSRNISKAPVQSTVLNPDGEKVSAVYYYRTDGMSDVLLYGKDQNPGGGIVTLPRLVLGYYLMIALAALFLSALLLLLFHRNKKARYWLVRIIALPVSYIIGHFSIRGSYSPTYSPVRDFIAIMIITVALYIVFLLTLALVNHYKRKTNIA